MTVDSFKFLPRIIAFYYQRSAHRSEMPIPWHPLEKSVSASRFGLVTSGGIYHRIYDPPFDIEREKKDPTWGDPTYRKVPINIKQNEVGVSHLHISTKDILSDLNILLPIHRFMELTKKGLIGSLSPEAYSFMGYQGFPPDSSAWALKYGQEVADAFLRDGVDCVLLTPA